VNNSKELEWVREREDSSEGKVRGRDRSHGSRIAEGGEQKIACNSGENIL